MKTNTATYPTPKVHLNGKARLVAKTNSNQMTEREQKIADSCTKALQRYPCHERLQGMVEREEIHVKVKGNEIHLYGEAKCHLIPQAASSCLSSWRNKDSSRKNLIISNHIQLVEPEVVSPFDDVHYNPSPWTSQTEYFYSNPDSSLLKNYTDD